MGELEMELKKEKQQQKHKNQAQGNQQMAVWDYEQVPTLNKQQMAVWNWWSLYPLFLVHFAYLAFQFKCMSFYSSLTQLYKLSAIDSLIKEKYIYL